MQHIRVGDLMTDEVVSVVPASPFKDVAKLLAQHDVSGLPVLDEEDRVVGVVSESDLLGRTAMAPEQGPVPLAVTPGRAGAAGTGLTAGDIMSAPAVTVRAEAMAPDAARLMTRRGVERLPVVDHEDRLVGILTRRDLLCLFLRPDAEIRRRLVDALVENMGLQADVVSVHVVDGVVTLEGRLGAPERIAFLTCLAEHLDGVVSVVNRVTACPPGPAAAAPGYAGS
ncbi:CBS domain-containing protein [Streptomyces sp. NPDC052052]|uniref:CBS domain-containing protein n=1 Tax=Streptomyces sp. NPDC052052 TaxID=3154756 RepID=UPI00343C5633